MTKVTISADIDPRNISHMKAAMEFMAVLGGAEASVNVIPATPLVKEVVAANPTPPNKPAPPPPPPPPTDHEQESDTAEIPIKAVRDLLSTRVKSDVNRPKIKKKLTSLGTTSVTALDPSKFQEFMDFLETLPLGA